MVVAARFTLSRKGVGDLLRSPEIEAEMLRRAELIKSIAQGTSPIGTTRDPHPGEYKESWGTTSTARGGVNRDRATATVYNTADHARFVEYGTDKVPAHHTLLRAAQIGGR